MDNVRPSPKLIIGVKSVNPIINVGDLQEMPVRSLGWEDPLEKKMATHLVTPFVIITFQRLTMDHLPLLNILEPHYCHSKLEAHCAGQIRYLHRARE